MSDARIERRLNFIEQRLDASERHARIWYWSWMTVNVGATVGLSVASAIADNGDDRATYIPQAALAALGVADLTVFRPLEARFGAEPIRGLPDGTRAERLHKLERAEALLRSNATRAESRRSWLLRLANFGLNAAAGAVTYATGNTSDAVISFASGFAGGEIYIWSEPGAPRATGRTTSASRLAAPQRARGSRWCRASAGSPSSWNGENFGRPPRRPRVVLRT